MFTLPSKMISEYEEQKRAWLRDVDILPESEKTIALKSKDGLFFAWFDELLVRSNEVPKILHRNNITDIIANSFKYFDGIRYKLLAYCIMPNHVHVLILPLKTQEGSIFSPARITYSWKRYTANQINAALDKSGSLWQKESYDRMIRDESELYNTIKYILQNPVKAGLVSEWKAWRGNFLCDELMGDHMGNF